MRATAMVLAAMVLAGCHGAQGEPGPAGERGPAGTNGKDGATGPAGMAGPQGMPGVAGKDGKDGFTFDGSRLKARLIVGDDGSRGFLGWTDATTGQSCTYSTASDGATRCLPDKYVDPNAAVFVEWTDANCTAAVVVVIPKAGTTVTQPPAWFALPDVSLPDKYVHLMTPASAPAMLYMFHPSTMTCDANGAAPPGASFWSADIVGPDGFVAGTVQ